MYVTVKEVVDEGGTGGYSRIERAIKLAQQYIERATGRFFEKKTFIIKLDSEGDSVIYLPYFLYSVISVKVYDVEADTDGYTIYNRFHPDDRNQPKITFPYDVTKGRQKIEINGEWGYVEEDGSTPEIIKKICIKLALNDIKLLADDERRQMIEQGRIVEEATDSHRYKLSEISLSGGPTGDQEIDDVIEKYSEGIGISAV